MGYSQTQNGYKCYEPKSKKLYTSRDVRFIETSSYFEETSQEDEFHDCFPLLNADHPVENTSTEEADATSHIIPNAADDSGMESIVDDSHALSAQNSA